LPYSKLVGAEMETSIISMHPAGQSMQGDNWHEIR
jgi:hypothetical protein